MPIKHQIGAAGRIYMADASAPEVVARTAQYDITKFLTGLTVTSAIATDNVTTLDTDLDNFAERFIAALSNSTCDQNYMWDAPTGSMLIRLYNVKNGNLHSLGRSKTNFIYDPFGSTSGYLSFQWTQIFTSIPFAGELTKAVMGQAKAQIDGPLLFAPVP